MIESIFLYGDKIGKVELVTHMGTDLTIVNSARVSFGKEKSELDDKDKKLISYLVKHRHTSTFEHNVVTFRCKVPLFVRSQHHRHRTWSYNEISRRYTDADLCFYEQDSYRTQHKSNRQASNNDLKDPNISESYNALCPSSPYYASNAIKDHHARSLELFNLLVKNGVCREQARGILPQNLYTEYYATCNLNNLLKFIDLRTHDGAQQEIRLMADAMLNIAIKLWPIAVQSYKENKHAGV